MKKILYYAFTLNLIIGSISSFGNEDTFLEKTINKTKRDVLTISGLGLGGAVLGLSTLAFFDEPKKHTKNIAIGGAVGIIIGVGIVAYSHATEGNTYYEEAYKENKPPEFNTSERLSWHQSKNEERELSMIDALPPVSYQFQF